MRVPILAANWKMNRTASEAVELVSEMMPGLTAVETVDSVLCPPYLAIPDVARQTAGSSVAVGAQDLYWEESGAYTGEVSASMVREFCEFVIIGHSERRQFFGESDKDVNRKIVSALAHGLKPIVCVGETLALREEGRTESWVSDQVAAAFHGLTAEQAAGIVVAYEPIWAIGTGLAATSDEAERICGQVIRGKIGQLYGPSTADTLRIQYGGSVKPGNATELMSQPNIDGALVGGASLQAADFVEIVRLSAQAKGLT